MKERINLPAGWLWTRLGEICELINGRAFKPEEWATKGIPIIRIQNLNNINTDFNYCNFEVEEKYIVNNGQLLFAWSGTPGTSFGAHIWNRGRAVLNQHIFKIGINENWINKMFFMYLINRNIDEYIGKAHGTAGLAHITKNKFENSIISIPPFPEQRRIVTKIEELFTRFDAGVSELKKTQAQLKRYRQSVLKAACEGKLVPTEAELAKAEGRTYEHADELLTHILKERREKSDKGAKYKEAVAPDISGLQEVPEGWCWTTVEQISFVGTGATPLTSKKEYYDKGSIPWITSGALNKLFISEPSNFVTEKALRETNLTLYPKHTLLVAMYGEGKTRGKCSELLIEATTNQAIAALVFENISGECRHFLKIFLVKNYDDTRMKSSGGVQPNLNLGLVKKIIFPLPPLAEQHRIVAEVERRLSIADGVEKTVGQSLVQAVRLRQSILKRAFEGRLVAQDASDEPAGVLLERIKQQKQLSNQTNKTTRRKDKRNT
ncbi:MAG: restriction endonuclease subunit S [Candidatus Methanoperedens sp.]|nr:restriction endonuclease subunit S [Candidatus Methanoperedens sp.]